MTPTRGWLGLLFACALAGCSGDRAPPPRGSVCKDGGNGNDGGPIEGLASASSNGTCGDLLPGTKPQGESCEASTDCEAVCCACPHGARSAQVAWCRDGACTSPDDACCAFAALYAADGGQLCQ